MGGNFITQSESQDVSNTRDNMGIDHKLASSDLAPSAYMSSNYPDLNFSAWDNSDYSSFSPNKDCIETNYNVSEGVKVFLTVSFVLTIVVCGIGNSLLCFLIVRHKRLRSVTNLLIGNLAGSDALVALFSAPLSLHAYLQQDWTLPSVLCPIVGTVKNVSLYVSVNTLLVIAIDRYIGIFRPLRPRMKKTTLGVIIALIWIVSILVTLPTPLKTRVVMFRNCHTGQIQHQCFELWHNLLAGKIYVSFITAFEFLIPFFTMGSIYLQIAMQLWMHRTPPGNQTERHREVTFIRKQKTIPMLITVVVAFFVCWAPYYVYQLAVNFAMDALENYSGHLALFYVVESIAMLNAVISTIIYFLMSPNFRSELTIMASSIFGRKCAGRSRTSDIDKDKFNMPNNTHSNISQGRNGYIQVGLVRKSSDQTAEARF
ncbi:prokineticin receptor 2 [Strongylocentrotus purpuratus]|uniref:G-protein coupled receptors family 1 profile domain-containing protein n=1 Tax=Strongylocentrotus purpuratus TaxID=7668 RepID=A0A7M7NGQ4_STRPU|nr:prokineticin receptor 2 [Strongylocentrotus purpuratus]|eukprot:XP_785812.1 PREDICTED: prokineticin receptor 2 [Strongylocentrotus purpuratus]